MRKRNKFRVVMTLTRVVIPRRHSELRTTHNPAEVLTTTFCSATIIIIRLSRLFNEISTTESRVICIRLDVFLLENEKIPRRPQSNIMNARLVHIVLGP